MAPLALFGSFGLQELLLILFIVLLLFGGRKIPEIARGLGEGIRNFRTSLKGDAPEGDGAARDGEGPKSPER